MQTDCYCMMAVYLQGHLYIWTGEESQNICLVAVSCEKLFVRSAEFD